VGIALAGGQRGSDPAGPPERAPGLVGPVCLIAVAFVLAGLAWGLQWPPRSAPSLPVPAPSHTLLSRGDDGSGPSPSSTAVNAPGVRALHWCEILEVSALAASGGCPGAEEGATVRPLLVTGVGRSGTTSFLKVLRAAGLDLSHDSPDHNSCNRRPPQPLLPASIPRSSCPGRHGAVSWVHAFAVSGMALSRRLRVQSPLLDLSRPFPQVPLSVGDLTNRTGDLLPPGDALKVKVAFFNAVFASSASHTHRCLMPTWAWAANPPVTYQSVVHLVREPLAVIASRASLNDISWESSWIFSMVDCLTPLLPPSLTSSFHTATRLQHEAHSPNHHGDGALGDGQHLLPGPTRRSAAPSWEAVAAALSQPTVAKAKAVVGLRHYVTWNLFVEAIAGSGQGVEMEAC